MRTKLVGIGLGLCAVVSVGGALNVGRPYGSLTMAVGMLGALAIGVSVAVPHRRNWLWIGAVVLWITPAWIVGTILGAVLLAVALAERDGLLPVKAGAR